jgi:hypothetical protein
MLTQIWKAVSILLFPMASYFRLIIGSAVVILTAMGLVTSCSSGTHQTEKQKSDLQDIISRFTTHYCGLDYKGITRTFGEPTFEQASVKSKAIRFLRSRSLKFDDVCISIYWDPKNQEKVVLVAKKFSQNMVVKNGHVSGLVQFTEQNCTRAELSEEQKKQFTDAIEPANLSELESFRNENATDSVIRPDTSIDGELWLIESWDHGIYRVAVQQNPQDGRLRRKCLDILELAKMNGFSE